MRTEFKLRTHAFSTRSARIFCSVLRSEKPRHRAFRSHPGKSLSQTDAPFNKNYNDMPKFRFVRKKNLQKKDDTGKWYASPTVTNRLNTGTVCRVVTRNTTTAPTELESGFNLVCDGIPLQLQLGNSVQLGKLGRYVDELLHRVAHEIGTGSIDADPCVRGPQESACDWCPFASACWFDERRDKPRYLQKTTPEEFWALVDREVSHG